METLLTMKDLRTYLAENKVEHLHGLFKRLGIDESHLLAKLKYSDLEKMGIENLIERRKIFDVINEISQDMYASEVEMNDTGYGDTTDEDGSCFPEDPKGGVARRRPLFSGDGVSVRQRLGSCNGPRGDSERHVLDTSNIAADDTVVLGSSNADSSMASECGETCQRGGRIVVCVRKRPCERSGLDIVDVEDRDVVVNESKLRVDLKPYTEQHRFVFDHSFDGYRSNIEIYRESVKGVVDHVVGGGFGTLLAYGQTGTGKTYTMLERDIGMVYLAIKDMLRCRGHGAVTFCEIYMGHVYDLLDEGKRIQLREVNGVVYLANSKEVGFGTYENAVDIINQGLSLRKTGTTGANLKSSRSHAVIIIKFPGHPGSRKVCGDGGSSGSMVFVDLAGSERGSDRRDAGSDTRNEGAEINKSLLALKECIRGIEKDHRHLPFRQSKLTQILKNSFVGMSRTCLIATISPVSENVEHTLNTLRYAARVKEGGPSGARSGDVSNVSVGRTRHVADERKPRRRLSFNNTNTLSEDMRRRGTVQEIRRILAGIGDILPSLQDTGLERVLNLCRDLEDKVISRDIE